MGTDPKGEFLAQIAHRKELIERSTNIIDRTNALIDQSHRLIGMSMRHDVDRGNNHKTMPQFPLKPDR
jgi:hypothetical protein